MPFVQKTTDLGFVVDSKLRFSAHATVAVSKVRRMLAMLKIIFLKMDPGGILHLLLYFSPFTA